jgi:hypothetical protein
MPKWTLTQLNQARKHSGVESLTAMNAWGLETLVKLAKGVSEKDTAGASDSGDRQWYARQDARIREAQRIAASLKDEALQRQRARIAALKRARTLGPAGLKLAAAHATAAKAANPHQVQPQG